MEPLDSLLSKVNSHQDLCRLLSRMGYKTKSQALYIPDLDLPQSTQNIIKELLVLADYNQRFQIYFAEITSMRRSDFRNIIEPFYRRYPQINALFIFTRDWEEVAFVSPERVASEDRKVKLLLRILLIDPKNLYHTDIEVLSNISLSPDEQLPESIWRKHSAAFNVERVTKEFFEAYKSALNSIKEDILIPQKKATRQQAHSFAQQLLSRIMFLYYIQKKGWLKWKDYLQDKRYIRNLWEKYKEAGTKKDTFYSLWLSSLFFYAFNKKHQYLTLNIPEEIKESFNLMPFLNGGLFTENELDKLAFKIPDEVFKLLFEVEPFDKRRGFLERYNFTIREDTPLEVEVAVDPEMLGKVYESLISEEERGKAGIFYTPRIEIDYMCRLSLVEYLAGETGFAKTDLISLVFDPKIILDKKTLTIEKLRKIKDALNKARIVDPAVGSASFLVGMMNVLVELQRNLSLKIEKKEENLFALKNKILSENLFGVDVKDWAVMVGELRLWLSLIIETEEKFMDIYTKPLLPNLTFKMRQGDSLVEEIAGVAIPLRGKFAYIPKNIKEKITLLVDRKVEYFRGGRSADLREKDEIERLENEVLRDIINNEIKKLEDEENKLNKQIAAPEPEQIEMFEIKPRQRGLFEEQIKKLKKRIEEIRIEKARFKNLFQEIGRKLKKDYFLWEVDFAEIFAEKGGFDIVIGNPPYVRQEMIAFPLEREEDFADKEEWRERKRIYKEKLVKSVKIHWGDLINIDKKSDLYVYFYYHGLALLRPGGVFCFINSNSWLDVGYGAGLQEFILKNMEPVYIIDNLAKRTFAESDVNTVIVLIKRSFKTNSSENKTKDEVLIREPFLKFIAFKKPFEEVLKPDVLIKIEETNARLFGEDFRVFPKSRKELLEEGVLIPEESEGDLIKEPMHLPYIGNKWGGKYLRAPEIYFKILEKGKGKFVRLGDIAEIQRGFTTGANEFFYLEPTDKRASKGLIHVKNGAGWEGFIEKEFLKPAICSTQQVTHLRVEQKMADSFIFICREPLSKINHKKHVINYISYGAKLKTKKGASHTVAGVPLPEAPSMRGRAIWYALPYISPGQFIIPRLIRERFFISGNPHKIHIGDMFFVGNFKSIKFKDVGVALLNSTLSYLFIELFGRINVPGRINVYGPEIKAMIIPDPTLIPLDSIVVILEAFKSLCNRPILPIDKEIQQKDRKEFDHAVLSCLNLAELQVEIYEALLVHVQNRLEKEHSLKEQNVCNKYF